MRVLKEMCGQNYANNSRTRIRESSDVYEFRADETTFYFVVFCVAFAMCMALSHSDRHRHIGRRLCVAVSTALVSCGIVSLVLAGFSSAGFTLTSPWPGLGMAAILGSLKEKVYTVGWDMLQWFWKGKINFTFIQKQDNDK